MKKVFVLTIIFSFLHLTPIIGQKITKSFTTDYKRVDIFSYNDRYMNSQNDLANLDERSDYMNSEKLSNTKDKIAKYSSDENTQKLAQEYPEGITEKLFERKNTRGEVIEVTILRIVVRGNKGDEYRKVKSKWGVSYFKNGGVTSEYIWDTETN